MSCHVMSCHVMSCHVISRHVVSHHSMSCHVISVLLISVGRKFSGIPLERALCCRLQDFRLNQVEDKKKGMKRYIDKKMRSEEVDQTLKKRGETEEEEGGETKGVVEKKGGEEGKEKEEEGVVESGVEIVSKRRCLYFIHHPVMMCTSIKLDNSAILTGNIERKVTTNHINTRDSDDNNISDDRNNEKINNDHKSHNYNNSNHKIDDYKNPVNDGADFSEIKCFCWWLENTDLRNTDFLLHENDQNFTKCIDDDYGRYIDGITDVFDNDDDGDRRAIGIKKWNFVIIDSREGLGLKQDYDDDKNNLSDCVDFEKNNNNDSNDGNTNNNYKNNHENNNNNKNDDENNDSDSYINNNNYNNGEFFRDNDNNICPVEITEKTNQEISAISSYALFTDFRNIVKRIMKCENNETVQNYQQGTYANNKNKAFLFLKNNQVSFPMYLDSDTNAGICHDIRKNYHSEELKSVVNVREIICSSSNPYSEAKRILFTETRFFQDWVRKKDFISS
jgi:hypothetical protein